MFCFYCKGLRWCPQLYHFLISAAISTLKCHATQERRCRGRQFTYCSPSDVYIKIIDNRLDRVNVMFSFKIWRYKRPWKALPVPIEQNGKITWNFLHNFDFHQSAVTQCSPYSITFTFGRLMVSAKGYLSLNPLYYCKITEIWGYNSSGHPVVIDWNPIHDWSILRNLGENHKDALGLDLWAHVIIGGPFSMALKGVERVTQLSDYVANSSTTECRCRRPPKQQRSGEVKWL